MEFLGREVGGLPVVAWLFALGLASAIGAAALCLGGKPCPPLTVPVCRETWRLQSTVEPNGMPGTILLPDESCVCKGRGK